MNTQPPKRSAPSIEPPRMFGRSYKPPRGKGASLLVMLCLALVILGVLGINKEKHKVKGPVKPRAVARPPERPLVIAVGTFSEDIPDEKLHWLRYAFADSLSRNLASIDGIQVIDRQIVAQVEEKLRHGEDLGRYAGALGADLVIGGEVWQQEPKVLGATVRALSPVDIFFAEEVAPEEDVLSLSALMAGYVAGVDTPSPWSPGSLSSYRDLLQILHREGTGADGLHLLRVEEQQYSELLQRDPGFVLALHQRAKVRKALLNFHEKTLSEKPISSEDVLADAAEAYRLSPDDPLIAAFLVDLCQEQDPLGALRVSVDFLKQDPHAAQLRYRVARLLFSYGLIEDAKLQLTKILEDDLSAGPAWQLLAWIALLQGDPKATFYTRHALAIEERWRAEGMLSTSTLRGWAPVEGSRVYVALAERETLSAEERQLLLDEDAGLYPRGGDFLGADELLLRDSLKPTPLQEKARDRFVAMLLGQELNADETFMALLQRASIAALANASPETLLQQAETLAKTPDEQLLARRWRTLMSSHDPPRTDDWLFE